MPYLVASLLELFHPRPLASHSNARPPLSERAHFLHVAEGEQVRRDSRRLLSEQSFAGMYRNVRWDSVGDISTSIWTERRNLHIRSASEGSSKQPEFVTDKSIWPCLLPRPLIYSNSFSDVDPVQLSELWAVTLKVRRDPKKILKALRHSFAFVVVLAEDDEVSSSGVVRRLKTVGVGRAISDGTFIASICDVAVDPAYQNRGIGRRIVKKLVENMKKTGGPSGYAVFPPPLARRFFWMIGFRSDKKYRLMAYRGQRDERDVKLIPKESLLEDKELFVRSAE